MRDQRPTIREVDVRIMKPAEMAQLKNYFDEHYKDR